MTNQDPHCIKWENCCSEYGNTSARTEFLKTFLLVLIFSFSEREEENFDLKMAVLMLLHFR